MSGSFMAVMPSLCSTCWIPSLLEPVRQFPRLAIVAVSNGRGEEVDSSGTGGVFYDIRAAIDILRSSCLSPATLRVTYRITSTRFDTPNLSKMRSM
jgi:hypothetical protein